MISGLAAVLASSSSQILSISLGMWRFHAVPSGTEVYNE